MKRPLIAIVASCAAISLTSCLQNETTVHLNKDGSGTLVEETTLGAQMTAMMGQMAAMGGPGAAAKKDPIAEMFSDEKAKARAAKLGEGVTLEKNEAITKAGNQGARATYHFNDINKLTVSTGDGIQNLSPMGGMGGMAKAEEKANRPIKFDYADGKLKVTMPKPEKAVEGPNDDSPKHDTPKMPDPNDPQMAMMQQMMSDMKLSLKLVIEPGIANTNASFQDGKTITLMDMEMGKLFANPEVMKNLQKMDKKDPAASLEMMRGIPGVKFETKPEIDVTLD